MIGRPAWQPWNYEEKVCILKVEPEGLASGWDAE